MSREGKGTGGILALVGVVLAAFLAVLAAVLPFMYCPNCPRDRRYAAAPCTLCEGARRISFITKLLRSDSR
jgi:hypothetical protein